MNPFKSCMTILGGLLFAACAASASAHGIEAEVRKFNQLYAGKDPSSPQAKEARAALARAEATFAHYEAELPLHMRELLAAGFKAVGAPPASIANEIVRLEASIARADGVPPAKLAEARKLLDQVKLEKGVSDALHTYFGEQMAQALKLIESAP